MTDRSFHSIEELVGQPLEKVCPLNGNGSSNGGVAWLQLKDPQGASVPVQVRTVQGTSLSTQALVTPIHSDDAEGQSVRD